MNRILLFLIITAIYLVSDLILLSFVDLGDLRRFLAKLFPSILLIAALIRSRSLKDNAFDSVFLSSIILTGTCLLVAWSINRMAVFQNLTFSNVTFHIGSNILTALFEEILFRVILFAGLFRFFKNSKWQFWKAIGLTALVFAAIHFTNVLRHDFSLYGAFTQVVFAFGIGVFLQVVYVVSRNVLIPISIHFLVNFFGTSGKLQPIKPMVVESGPQDLSSLLFLIIFCALLVGLSALIYRKEAFEKFGKAHA